MTALVRRHTLDKAVNGLTEPQAAKRRFPAPSYVHHVPGRLRMKAAEFRENPSILEATRRDFAALPAVSSVSPNRLTGSILVEYDPLVSAPAALFAAMEERGFPQMPLSATAGAQSTSLTERLAEAAARSLFDWLVERLVAGAIAAVI